MPEVQKYSLPESLNKADKELSNSISLLGMTALTMPQYNSAMRSNMFTSHIRQYLALLKSEFPYLATGAENDVGKNSSGYKKYPHEFEIVKKIEKFKGMIDDPCIYTLFIFDHETQQFDVITRKPIENLTENFGFEYDNDVIDSFKEGDTISPDTILYKSKSYDDDMNYGYGKNVRTMYTLEPFTTEDAAVVSESLAREMTSIETEAIRVGLNDNDFLINLYGLRGDITDDNYMVYYKPLPEIGQKVSGVLLATRRQFNNQLLFDFKRDSLNEIHEGDSTIYVGIDEEIVDYTIYNNNEETKETSFNRQVNEILYYQNKYYKEIRDTCLEIKNSGFKYSKDVDYLLKRSEEMLDTKKKWKDGDNAFSNMVIEITIKKVVPLSKGQKITGRYGNKSVISEIRPDSEMPYTADGERVDLLLNVLAIINRTTSMPLFELAITSIASQVRKKMASFRSFKKREELLIDFLHMFNPKDASEFKRQYDPLPLDEKKEWIQSAIDDGIYLHQPPVNEPGPIFYRIRDILAKYDWLKPDKVFINKWGREIPVLNNNWIGYMYILKLKQSDRRGFSVRSTGAIDIKGLPTRSHKNKNHLEQNSTSAIRFGEYETLNLSIGLPMEDIALFHAFYRTSIKGRKDIVKMQFTDPDSPDHYVNIDPEYDSRVIEIFEVICKSLSIGITFDKAENEILELNRSVIRPQKLNDLTILCSDYELFLIERGKEIRDVILEDNTIMEFPELEEEIDTYMQFHNYIRENETVRDIIGDSWMDNYVLPS